MIHRHIEGDVATLRLAHGKANALDVELLTRLNGELDALVTGPGAESGAPVRALILTGTDRIFSAGVDLRRLVAEGPAYIRRFFPLLAETLRRIFALDAPLVAAVNGHAIAGGCLLALACDYRLMAEGEGRIGIPELTVGLPFPAVAHEIVRFAVPAGGLPAFTYLGTTLPPREALAAGLVDEVSEAAGLETRARAVAAQLGRVPPEIFRHTKRSLRAEALERLARREEAADAEALAAWLAPETLARVNEYVSRVLRRQG